MLERPDAGTPMWEPCGGALRREHGGPGPDGNHPPILATT
jgi:hypothetical protein